jgi:hypothetical protein
MGQVVEHLPANTRPRVQTPVLKKKFRILTWVILRLFSGPLVKRGHFLRYSHTVEGSERYNVSNFSGGKQGPPMQDVGGLKKVSPETLHIPL